MQLLSTSVPHNIINTPVAKLPRGSLFNGELAFRKLSTDLSPTLLSIELKGQKYIPGDGQFSRDPRSETRTCITTITHNSARLRASFDSVPVEFSLHSCHKCPG